MINRRLTLQSACMVVCCLRIFVSLGQNETSPVFSAMSNLNQAVSSGEYGRRVADVGRRREILNTCMSQTGSGTF